MNSLKKIFAAAAQKPLKALLLTAAAGSFIYGAPKMASRTLYPVLHPQEYKLATDADKNWLKKPSLTEAEGEAYNDYYYYNLKSGLEGAGFVFGAMALAATGARVNNKKKPAALQP